MPSNKEAKPEELGRFIRQSSNRLLELEQRLRRLQGDMVPAQGPFLGAEAFAAVPQGSPFGGPMPGFAPLGPVPIVGPAAPFGSTWGSPALTGPGLERTAQDLHDLPPIPRTPEANLIDAADHFVLHVGLPGVKKDGLEITVTENALRIRAEARPDPASGTVLLAETPPIEFRRTVALPTECNTQQSKASLKDGVLTVRVPKKEPTKQPRRLDVAYG